MLDKNGREIKTGDKVVITGGYFKNDNGTFIVTNSPGDPNWCGRDHALHRLNKDGSQSTAKYSTQFWPIFVTTNSYTKRCEAKRHNAEHAQIEVIQ